MTKFEGNEDLHIKTYTRWINVQLSYLNPPLNIENLCNDLRDGTYLNKK